MRAITLSQAVNEAIAEEMRLDKSVFLMVRTWLKPEHLLKSLLD